MGFPDFTLFRFYCFILNARKYKYLKIRNHNHLHVVSNNLLSSEPWLSPLAPPLDRRELQHRATMREDRLCEPVLAFVYGIQGVTDDEIMDVFAKNNCTLIR